MANLQHLLKEYLELDDNTINEFMIQVKIEWEALVYNKLPDTEASDLLEKLLGIPDWTKV